MTGITVSVETSAPPERVWRLATHLEGSPDTLSGVDSVEMLSEGAFGAGTRWRETRTVHGRAATEEMWVTAVDAPRSYTVEAESHGARYVSTFDFAPSGGGTTITLTFDAQPTNLATRIVTPLTARLMRRSVATALQRDLDDLAAAAERATDGA